MATSKTLTPTNVTIQIPAFADKPDQRLNSDCLDKEADAINALSDQIATKAKPSGTLHNVIIGANVGFTRYYASSIDTSVVTDYPSDMSTFISYVIIEVNKIDSAGRAYISIQGIDGNSIQKTIHGYHTSGGTFNWGSAVS